jgi:outer membrane protein TolC
MPPRAFHRLTAFWALLACTALAAFGQAAATGAATAGIAPEESVLAPVDSVSLSVGSDVRDSASAPKGPGRDSTVTPVAAVPDSAGRPKSLTLEEALDRLLRGNAEIGKSRQAWLATRDRYHGSFGIFEPALVGSFQHQATDRPYLLIAQRQNVYTGGIEGLLPTATKYNLGFSFTDLSNKFVDNVERPTAFTGITLTQPLLQGLWFGKPISEIKAARADQKAALHRYRAALCATISELQSSYWKLRYAQDKFRFAAQSVSMARELSADSRIKFRVGKISEVDTIEAAAGLANRQAALATAQMELNTAMSELKILVSGDVRLPDALLEATSPLQAPSKGFVDSLASRIDLQRVFERQPDYLQKTYETQRQQVAFDAQTDQCLPELTLKGTWGYQVTGTSTYSVWDKFTDDRYRRQSTTYSAGVEVRIPLGMNIKERGARSAEGRTLKHAEIDEQATRIQLDNYIRISIKRLGELRNNIENASIVVDFRETLLKAEMGRQRVGKSDYHKIFETEDELTKAKLSAMENTVEFLSTRGQLQRLTGSTLIDLGLESFEDDIPILDKRLLDPSFPIATLTKDEP